VNELLRELPRRLREQALIDLYEPVLSMGQLFPHLDNRIIGAVLFYLEPQTYSPGEVVIKKGTPGSAMHIVCSGMALLPSSPLSARNRARARAAEVEVTTPENAERNVG